MPPGPEPKRIMMGEARRWPPYDRAFGMSQPDKKVKVKPTPEGVEFGDLPNEEARKYVDIGYDEAKRFTDLAYATKDARRAEHHCLSAVH